MTPLRTSFTNAARVVRPGLVPSARHGISMSTSARLGLKESSSQTDADYDKHKKDSLNKQKQGQGHWKPELASDSEEAVRADRGVHESAAALQERTKGAAEAASKAGTSTKDGI